MDSAVPFGRAIPELGPLSHPSSSCQTTKFTHTDTQSAHLQITAAAGGGVLQHPDLKLFEAHPQNPVPGRSAKGTETVPAREGLTPIRWGHRRARHIFVNVHCLVAVTSVR